MRKKILSIDYIRGISILAIIMIHIISLNDSMISNSWYLGSNVLFLLRDILQFAVVAVVICSGISMYNAYKEVPRVWYFYMLRIGRLLKPWFLFSIIYFTFFWIIRLVTGLRYVPLDFVYIIQTITMIGGLGVGWLVLLMLMLMLAHPILLYGRKKLGNKKQQLLLLLIYGFSYGLYVSLGISYKEYVALQVPIIGLLSLGVAFAAGWMFIYGMAFSFSEIARLQHIKHELQLFFYSLLATGASLVLWWVITPGQPLYSIKYPPSPLYLSIGLLGTSLLFLMIHAYQDHLQNVIGRILQYFSRNSFEIFTFSLLVQALMSPVLFQFIGHMYIRFIAEFIINVLVTVGVVGLYNKMLRFAAGIWRRLDQDARAIPDMEKGK
ncbi:MAG: acyltransferase family protein [Nanoarchaeota archaeon]